MTLMTFTTSASPLRDDAIAVDSDDALVMLTPTLGPTSTMLLHRIARYCREQGSVTFDDAELAATFGLMPSSLHRSLARLAMFHMIFYLNNDMSACTVRLDVVVGGRWLTKLPEYLQPVKEPTS